MISINEVINNLNGVIAFQPATSESLKNAEEKLKLSFSKEYKEYLENYGAIIADGIELTGIAKSKHRNVVDVTIMNWEINVQVPKNMYVVEDTHIDGVVIWQDELGVIYKTEPNNKPNKIFTSLAEYLSNK